MRANSTRFGVMVWREASCLMLAQQSGCTRVVEIIEFVQHTIEEVKDAHGNKHEHFVVAAAIVTSLADCAIHF